MDHLVQFTISIDDAHIADLVEKKAAEKLEAEVIKVVKATVGEEKGYWSYGMNKQALAVIEKYLESNKDYIVQEAAKEIATRVMRSKKTKDAVLEKLGEAE